jgi:hypothetical protein
MSNGVEVKIENVDMQALVAGQVLAMLSPVAREKLIESALTQLLSGKVGYDGKNAITRAVDEALSKLAVELCRQVLAADEALVEKMKSLVTEAVNRVFDEGAVREQIIEKFAESIRAALSMKK